MAPIVCRTKPLPLDKLEAAARRAIELNPENDVARHSVRRTPVGRVGGVSRIAVVTGRRWPASGVRLSVSFMDNPSAALRKRILAHMNAWSEGANVLFRETHGVGEVRIARLDSPQDMAGYWSYIGTEILEAPADEPTLNLEGFTLKVSEAEFRRVVRHEAGHTLGFEHEHMRSDIVAQIDAEKAYVYYDRTQGWERDEVDAQVLTPLAKRSLMGTTESDPLSIMCYHLPASIMKTRKAVIGGSDINPGDAAFAGKIYPKRPRAPVPPPRSEAAGAPAASGTSRSERDALHIMILSDGGAGAGSGRAASPEFAQVLATYGGARVMAPMRLRKGGKGLETRFGEIISMHERIRAYTNRTAIASGAAATLPNDQELLQFGKDLFETLFQGDVRRLYDEARVRERGRLDLVLTSMIPWLAEKPWEFAFDPSRQTFLATEDLHFVRNVLTSIPADPIPVVEGPLEVLVAAAQPVGFGMLSIDQEIAVIRRGFRSLVEAKLAHIEVVPRATPAMLHARLSTKRYQILHFIGHGQFDEAVGEGKLIFETEVGREYAVSEREAREIFCGRGLSLVFLNACETGRGGRAEFNKGVAQSFVQHGMPAVIANQYTVLDSSATAFAQHLYWSLAQGMSLGQAAREARIAVNYAQSGNPIDWAVPVLYARDPNATLCAPPPVRSPAPATLARERTHRAMRRRHKRVGVWDVDDVFPQLEDTLDKLNGAQDYVGCALIDLPAPLDMWCNDDQSYLRAEHLAERLRDRPAELGVDLLVCVTRHQLADEEYENLYGWWPEQKQPAIAILSVAGFDQLQPAGPETDRVIANAMVAAMAGFFGDMRTHGRRGKCPLFFNEARDFRHLASRQTFDAQCRKTLLRKHRDLLLALERLLELF